jgi:Domain of unknown function (DUF4494)
MATWFQCKIQYVKFLENDKIKTVSETYLVDAVSFTDAEARLYRSIGSTIPEFNVVSVGKTSFREVHNYDDTEIWFKVKVSYVDAVDEGGLGKEKRITMLVLIAASNPKQAIERVEEQFKSWVIPYDITDVNVSPIIEVIPYVSEEEENIKGGKLKPLAKNQPEIDDTFAEVEEEIVEEEFLEEDDLGSDEAQPGQSLGNEG